FFNIARYMSRYPPRLSAGRLCIGPWMKPITRRTGGPRHRPRWRRPARRMNQGGGESDGGAETSAGSKAAGGPATGYAKNVGPGIPQSNRRVRDSGKSGQNPRIRHVWHGPLFRLIREVENREKWGRWGPGVAPFRAGSLARFR